MLVRAHVAGLYRVNSTQEYHYKGHEPYEQLLHTAYAQFDTLPPPLYNIILLMSYIYYNNYYAHWIGSGFLKDIFVVRWYRWYKQKIDNKIMVAMRIANTVPTTPPINSVVTDLGTDSVDYKI